MRIAVLLFFGLMAAIGLGYLLASLQRWLLRPKGRARLAVVVPVLGAPEDIEYTLRSARDNLQSQGTKRGPALLVADYGADEETLALCRAFCRECPAARLCAGEELPELLKSLSQ